MFAVIKTGGKQYRVAANDEFEIERVPGEAGDQISFKEVLMIGTTIGAPFVTGASVVAEIVEQTRGPKVISFKKRRRQNSKRTRGHRQDLTLVRIGEILTDGKGPSEKPKKAAKKADVASDETTEEKAVKSKAEKDEAKPLKAAAVAEETETAAKAKPAKKAKEKGVIDIDGIGPVFRDRLAEHGVTTLEQIAALDDAGIDALNETADLQGQIRADDWVGQAKALIAENAKAAKA